MTDQRTTHHLRDDMWNTYLYTRIINPILDGRVLEDDVQARHHARVVYDVFRTKKYNTDAEISYRALFKLLNITKIEDLPISRQT